MKQKTCKHCRIKFTPSKPGQIACSVECAEVIGRWKTAKQEMIAALEDRKTIRMRKEAIKTRSQWMKEAQVAFNAYIRERDKNELCICCENVLASEAIGGGFDCGHYRSVGSAPHLRFDERNAHGQRKQCNRYGAGRAVDYRIGLIRRIGIREVENLEHDNEPRKYSIEELKQIKATYNAKLKELKNGN
jgi:hypothetical protein